MLPLKNHEFNFFLYIYIYGLHILIWGSFYFVLFYISLFKNLQVLWN